jgi:SPP1 gp7 family putative phage head morphogenesis protein
LNDRLTKDLQDMICLGKSPNQIKERLAADFNTAYHNADRLIRTEANHIYNSAAKDGYKAAGVEQVEFYPEVDCCEECESYKGTYDINNVPLLPIHPNCRCCYIPVVSLEDN